MRWTKAVNETAMTADRVLALLDHLKRMEEAPGLVRWVIVFWRRKDLLSTALALAEHAKTEADTWGKLRYGLERVISLAGGGINWQKGVQVHGRKERDDRRRGDD